MPKTLLPTRDPDYHDDYQGDVDFRDNGFWRRPFWADDRNQSMEFDDDGRECVVAQHNGDLRWQSDII